MPLIWFIGGACLSKFLSRACRYHKGWHYLGLLYCVSVLTEGHFYRRRALILANFSYFKFQIDSTLV